MLYPAPLPQPQYIDWEHNVSLYVGMDKVSVGDMDRTQIPTALVNQLIAAGEQIVLEDLSPYYITSPTLQTINNIPWINLPNYTYTMLYYAFVNQAALKIVGNFLTRNGEDQTEGLTYFHKYYTNEYNQFLNRLHDLLPNGSYRYALEGLAPARGGIPRRPKHYANSGLMGGDSYSDDQVTNASLNFWDAWSRNNICGCEGDHH